MAPVWLATREDVSGALDVKITSRTTRQLDRALEAASRAVEGRLHRRFRPTLATRYFEWPSRAYRTPWRLWLDADELISVTELVAGGTTISAADYFLEPDTGPPFRAVEIDLAGNAAFAAGATPQRAIAITGLYGHSNDEATAGSMAEALDDSETGIDVSDSGAVGVGDVLRVDSERMVVTDKAMLDTGQNSSALTALASAVTITGITAGTLKVGEAILVDSERMLVVDVAGTTVTVKRAWDGSVLAAHSNGADIYAARTLTVQRAALGTTAATHSDQATIWRHLVPGLVRELTIAEAINTVQQEASGYSRRAGIGEERGGGRFGTVEATGRGLDDIREQAYFTYGRKARVRAI